MSKAIPIPPAPRLAWYGLTEEDFIALWEFQDGKCYVCQRPFTRGRPANIDHSHVTWQVRGLLCGSDNQEFGWKHDNQGWFERAGEYLKNPPADQIFDRPRRVQDAPPEVEL